mgnify:CR=1 FL=1
MALSIALLALLPAGLGAQEENGISVERIELLLNARQSSRAILQLIETNGFCLSFRLDAETRQRLREAGGDDELLTGLENVAVCGEEEEAREEEPAVEEETPAPAEEEPAARAGAGPYSPGSAALRSLAVPGLGHFYTGNPVLGGLFLAGWAGALGFGVMSQEVTVYCLAQTTESCPSGQVRNEEVERPMLLVGVGAAAALAVGSALHARASARQANARMAGGGGGAGRPGISLRFLPTDPPPRPTDVVVLQLRF